MAYKVYVRTAENGIITAINSSAFLQDTTGWTEIDEGSGDRYHHAQGNYLTAGLIDSDGLYNYRMINGEPELRTDEDKAPEREQLAAARDIAKYKRYLADTDYVTIKIAEGVATAEEYVEILAHRRYWRSEINRLEDENENY